MIHLPEFFERTLSARPELAHAVRQTLNLFEPWLEQSGMPFFPGYTDHGPQHIADVLKTAASLISDASRPLLTPEDIAALCMAILLHDCGMHLTHDGFRALVAQSGSPVVMGLGDRPWSEIWSEFLSEAARFGEEKLTAVFGASEPYRTDLLNLDNLSERDCLLIGEFVRRHHARLAQEVAICGVPSNTGTLLRLTGFDSDLVNIAGLIARSHGMSIRDTFHYIRENFGLLRECRRVKIPYLMAVLRIADYLQVQSERAVAALLSVKELRSPISRQEWRAHFSVRDISTHHDDPEALYVHAVPPDIKTYLKLDTLFKDIQRELDDSFATLGEVYGRFNNMAVLGLTIRRIRSNFENRETLARSVPFIPIEARLRAGPDLLRLLIGPLYNDDCSVGVRELVQNAVDACRELADFKRDSLPGTGIAQDVDVLVELHELDDRTGWITVSDKGIGMTLETVTQYFLVAGASFRNSEVWRKQHTNEAGDARPLRGGRFGVGVLAAYLLGNEITVITRHVTQDEAAGLEFRVRVDDPLVDLRRCKAPVGTTVKVRVCDPGVFAALCPRRREEESSSASVVQLKKWDAVDWFFQSAPRVLYRWNGFDRYPDEDEMVEKVSSHNNNLLSRFRAEYCPNPLHLVPSPEEGRSSWNELADSTPYKAVYWKFVEEEKAGFDDDDDPLSWGRQYVTVNGIRIGKTSHLKRYLHRPVGEFENRSPMYSVLRPSIGIFDPAAHCPLNLQRNSIDFDRMETEGRLTRAVVAEHVRNVVGRGKELVGLGGLIKLCDEVQDDFDDEVRGFARGVEYGGGFRPFFLTRYGYALMCDEAFAELGIRTLLLVDRENAEIMFPASDLLDGEAILLRTRALEAKSSLDWFRATWCHVLGISYAGVHWDIPDLRVLAAVSSVTAQRWARVNQRGRVAAQIRKPLHCEALSKEMRLVSYGPADQTAVLQARLTVLLGERNAEITAWAIDSTQRERADRCPLVDVWRELFGGLLFR